ncbi:stage III sporulation protein AB [Brevibacillus fluminis]|uniref:Stage III sporulation protein AB n=1 Tax=Brevibacillus fluminis TaxID=511487 RepID=A0A3M8D0R1_9BACL|nr:stage III sporulation protein SpoIIIAB [Brevibacillus fluminis]RNB81151.1 stage III sporulation protein AB [Brevibacillus fluminis]
MLKLIGAAVILFSCSMVGWQMGRYYAFRPLDIRTMIISLQMLETEIVYGATPLHRAMAKIGERMRSGIGRMFLTASELLTQEDEPQSTSESWRQAIEKNWSQTAMRKSEKDILLTLGMVLGNSDRDDQQKHLRLAITHLQGLEEEARSDKERYEKMYKSLGFLGGLLVVILML